MYLLRIIFLFALTLFLGQKIYAQASLSQYQYWFDDDYAGANTAVLTGNNTTVNTLISTTNLPYGTHTLTFRAKDAAGKWSSAVTQFFVKTAKITAYEYWFDTAYAQKVDSSLNNAASDFIMLSDLGAGGLTYGMHTLNIRTKDEAGKWSSVVVQNFIKKPKLSAAEYWIDDDYGNKQTISFNTDTVVFIDDNFSMAGVSASLHRFNFRTQDESGKWSSVLSSFFMPQTQIIGYEYWIDTVYSQRKQKPIQPTNFVTIPDFSTDNSIPDGNHTISYRFVNNKGVWSTTNTEPFYRGPIIQKDFLEPKLILSSGQLSSGQQLIVSGSDFFPNGLARLHLETPLGNNILIDNLDVDIHGDISKIVDIDNGFETGEYKLVGTDYSNNKSTTVSSFWVSAGASSSSAITFLNPSKPFEEYDINKPMIISWKIFAPAYVSGSAFLSKSFKLEESWDSGNTWSVVNSNISIPNLKQGVSYYSFAKTYTPTQQGTVLLRISDLFTPSITAISEPVIVSAISSPNMLSSLEWDKSATYNTTLAPHPIGVAADSTARILLKVTPIPNANIGNVTKVTAHVYNAEGVTDIAILGKVKFADNPLTYNHEANTANAISDSKIMSASLSNYYFWYVAPDDYTQDASDYSQERSINVRLVFEHTLGADTVYYRNIKIVRPPLMMVHGLNGSSSTFSKAKYEQGGQKKYFKDGLLWKTEPNRVNLLNYEHYDVNAKILLGSHNPNNPYHDHTFAGTLRKMHNLGYAACRVDYVCHSMGGDIARTVINKYPNEYRTAIGSSREVKNYAQGYINKLITINTPHNGSPIADILCELFPDNAPPSGLHLLVKLAEKISKVRLGFFQWTGTSYRASNAIKDLRYLGGIRFNQTMGVRAHFVGANIWDTYPSSGNSIQSAQVLAGSVAPFNQSNDLETELINVSVLSEQIGEDRYVKIDRYIFENYGIDNFLINSDGVVSVKSQLPIIGLNMSNVPDILSQQPYQASLAKELSANHLNVTDITSVGNRVMSLLNAPIASDNFTSQIAANPLPGGTRYRQSLNNNSYYIDTNHCKILSPVTSSANYWLDSTIIIQYQIKDTVNIRDIHVSIQGKNYSIADKTEFQSLSVKANADLLGSSLAYVCAVYDSAGYGVFHFDTVTINVNFQKDSLLGIYLAEKSHTLNKGHQINFDIKGILPSQVIPLSVERDTVQYTIADLNVIAYQPAQKAFVAKNSGATYIEFSYKGFKDTAYVYISSSDDGVGIRQPNLKRANQGELTVYPNPASSALNIAWNGADFRNGNVSITNVQGIVVLQEAIHYANGRLSKEQIDVAHLTSGVYFISLKAENSIDETRKIIVVK